MGNPDQFTTPIDLIVAPQETITVVDPRHPLFGRILPCVGISNSCHRGRCCIVWIRPTVERHVPVTATNLEYDPSTLYPLPISLESLQQLLQEFLLVAGARNGDPTLAASIFEALNARIPESMPLLEDALPTLAALRQRGFLLGVVTNRLWGGEAFREDLRALGLLDYFDTRAIAVSADLCVRKPHPALFLRALEALNLAPQEAALVGDSLRTDILGAQHLGIFTVWLPRAKQRQQIEEYVAVYGAVPAPPNEPAARGASTEPQADERLSDDVNFFDEDYLPATVQGKDGYLERYLRGELAPDVLIERVSDLLDVFG